MNLDFSADQKHLKTEVRRLLAAKCPISRVRNVLDSGGISYDEQLWRTIAGQGWLGTAIPEAYGGLGLGHVELCALAEELGRALAPIPFATTVYFFAEAILAAGSNEQKAELLPRLAAGELIGVIASSEGPGPVTPANLRSKVSGDRLTGAKIPVTDGDIANYALVLAQENGQAGLYLADLSGPGVRKEALQSLDPTRDAARLVFDGAAVTRLGAEGDGFDLLAHVYDRAAVLLAFEQLGGADRSLEIARDYALERYAFGRPIGSYQALKHRLADMYIKNELARSNAYYGAWAISTDSPELPLAASAARLSATEAFNFAARENIHIHGGVGFTWAIDCHLYYRRSRQLGLAAGPPRVWTERLVRQIEARNEA